MKSLRFALPFFVLMGVVLPLVSVAQTVPTLNGPQAGQKIAFLGDSITSQGEGRPTGYVRLVEAAFKQQGRAITVIEAGVGGNTSKDMLARLQKDVLDKKPDWMTLSCGVNDVWHGDQGMALDQYKINITSIVDQATAAGIKVLILTATMISENQADDKNQKLIAYNGFLRQLAKEKNLPLADLNSAMQALVTQIQSTLGLKPNNLLTVDGVHMNGIGDEMMAAEILKAFGFTDAQIAQARDTWLDMPAGMDMMVHSQISVRQYMHLRDLAVSQNSDPSAMLNEALAKDVQGMLSAPVPDKAAK